MLRCVALCHVVACCVVLPRFIACCVVLCCVSVGGKIGGVMCIGIVVVSYLCRYDIVWYCFLLYRTNS